MFSVEPAKDKSLCSIKAASEQDATLAQKLGQLQPSVAAFPQACIGQRASFWPTYHLSRRHAQAQQRELDPS
jgi:hypothetical protein